MQSKSPASARWPAMVVVLGAVLLAAGAAIALLRPAILVSPYFAVRNLAMALLLLALLFVGLRRALGNRLVLVAAVQLLDALMDCLEGRWMLVPGVTLLGILFLFAAARLCGPAFWRRSAWVS
jgi:hypothetical protein